LNVLGCELDQHVQAASLITCETSGASWRQARAFCVQPATNSWRSLGSPECPS